MIAFYEDHAAHRDKFEVFAIHDDAAKSFADLDKKLAAIKAKHWQAKDLPFPILLDGERKTHKIYGINSWPTGLLIDPVGEADISMLEAKLPPLPADKKWARHRDMEKNVFWSYEPKENTLNQFADSLKRWSGCDISIDADAVKASGLKLDGPLPGVLIGSPITLRSIEEVLLAPHGLGLVPSAEKQMLVITMQQPKKESASYLQNLHNKELNERLDGVASATGSEEAKSLEIKDKPLLEAVKLIGREYELPMGLDAKAMHTGALDPEAKVNGRIDPAQLRKSLTAMLRPLGLTVEVRHELVMVIPARK